VAGRGNRFRLIVSRRIALGFDPQDFVSCIVMLYPQLLDPAISGGVEGIRQTEDGCQSYDVLPLFQGQATKGFLPGAGQRPAVITRDDTGSKQVLGAPA
jgi:hypothetical protein